MINNEWLPELKLYKHSYKDRERERVSYRLHDICWPTKLTETIPHQAAFPSFLPLSLSLPPLSPFPTLSSPSFIPSFNILYPLPPSPFFGIYWLSTSPWCMSLFKSLPPILSLYVYLSFYAKIGPTIDSCR